MAPVAAIIYVRVVAMKKALYSKRVASNARVAATPPVGDIPANVSCLDAPYA
jgi:hypothetical protein